MTKVVFRKFKDGDVIALFPNEYYNEDLYGDTQIMSYMHIGQHGQADRTLIKELQKASEAEYKDLLQELVSIGYDDLKVGK